MGERAEARRAGGTVADLVDAWLAPSVAAEWRPKTAAEFTRLARAELVPALGDLRPEAVTKAHVRAIYDSIAQRSVSM